MADLVSAKVLASQSGKTQRYWQKLAQAGKLPFASQPGGKGTAIFFDLAGYEQWLAQGKLGRRPWRKSIGAQGSPGHGRRSKAWNIGSPLVQGLREKLKSVSKSG